MTTYNKQTLKTFFEQGDKPQGSDYANLIDSQVNIVETFVQSMGGALATTELITPRVSAANANFTGTVSASQFAGTVNFQAINVRDSVYFPSGGGIGINTSAGVNNNIVIDGGPGTLTTAIILKVSGSNTVGQTFQNESGSMVVGFGLASAGTDGFFQASDAFNAITPVAFNIRSNNGIQPVFTADLSTTTVQPFNNLRQPVAIISAAGTAQATATLCSAAICRLQGVTDGSTTGFSIPANKTGWVQYILNETAVSANLWPPTGGTINNGTANTAFALAAKTSYTIFHIAASAYGVK